MKEKNNHEKKARSQSIARRERKICQQLCDKNKFRRRVQRGEESEGKNK